MLSILFYKDHTYLTLFTELKCETDSLTSVAATLNRFYYNNQTHGYMKGQTRS